LGVSFFVYSGATGLGYFFFFFQKKKKKKKLLVLLGTVGLKPISVNCTSQRDKVIDFKISV